MAGYQRLSAMDTALLLVERPPVNMNIGALLIFEHLDATPQEVVDHVASRMHRLPRFRRKLMEVPFGLGRPVWVDDENFDINFHVRHVGLGGAGDEAALLDLFGRLQSIPLDRSRPLWEIWLVDLPDGRHAAIQKVHHAMADGVSDVEILVALLDLSRDWTTETAPEWKPVPPPSSATLLTESTTEAIRRPLSALRGGIASVARDPRQFADNTAKALRAATATVGAVAKPTPKTSLDGPIGSRRRFQILRLELDSVKEAKARHGTTVNDVAVAMVTCGLGALLEQRGELPKFPGGLRLEAVVPMSTRPEAAAGTMGNRFAPLRVELPVCETDPVAVLADIHAQTTAIKHSKALPGGDALLEATEFLPTPLISLGARTVIDHQHLMSLMITNVPGPQFPLYFRGAELLEIFPYVSILQHTSIGVAVASYNGQLAFGIAGDWDSTPDLDVMTEGMAKAFATL